MISQPPLSLSLPLSLHLSYTHTHKIFICCSYCNTTKMCQLYTGEIVGLLKIRVGIYIYSSFPAPTPARSVCVCECVCVPSLAISKSCPSKTLIIHVERASCVGSLSSSFNWINGPSTFAQHCTTQRHNKT